MHGAQDALAADTVAGSRSRSDHRKENEALRDKTPFAVVRLATSRTPVHVQCPPSLLAPPLTRSSTALYSLASFLPLLLPDSSRSAPRSTTSSTRLVGHAQLRPLS